MFSIIFTSRFIKKLIKTVSLLTLFAFSACYTTSSEFYTPDEIKTKEYYKIDEVALKNGTKVNLEDYDVAYSEHRDSVKANEGFLNWESKINPLEKNVKQNYINKRIQIQELKLSDIQKVKVEIRKFSSGNTILLSSGIILGVITLVTVFYYASYSGLFFHK